MKLSKKRTKERLNSAKSISKQEYAIMRIRTQKPHLLQKQLITISKKILDQTLITSKRNHLTFETLNDSHNHYTKSLNLVFQIPLHT